MFRRIISSRGLLRGSALGGALLAAVLMAAAPAPAPKGPDKDAVKLLVENNNYLDIHVYAMRDGYYRSLGVVTGLSVDELSIPATLLTPGAELQILVDPIGGTLSYLTDPIVMGTGKEIDLTVQNTLDQSFFTIK